MRTTQGHSESAPGGYYRIAARCQVATHQMTLEITQGGMNRKDDLFKVVFYPGADKREKGILGEILLQ